MKLCDAPNCNQPVFRTDKNTRKKYCRNHYFQYSTDIDKRSIVEKGIEKAIKNKKEDNESLSNLIEDLDAVFSLFIRLRDCDKNGILHCYTCDAPVRYQDAQNSHFIPRSHMATRFNKDNCHSACKKCNEYLSGNLTEYEKRLEKEKPGIVEFLKEESLQVYKYSLDELKGEITTYRNKVEILKRKLK